MLDEASCGRRTLFESRASSRQLTWFVDPGGRLEHQHILREVAGDLGLLLWQALRDVHLWACTPPERRKGLFQPAAAERRLAHLAMAGAPPEADGPLTTLSVLLSTPAQVDPCTLAGACLSLARWLGQSNAPLSRLSFTEAAALATPANAAGALAAARAALDAGLSAHAERWLRHALALARRGQQGESLARAQLALGELLEATHPAGARRHFARALRVCKRYRLGSSSLRGAALHGLFRLARTHAPQQAAALLRRALRALRAYGPGPEQHRAAHDYAVLLREQNRPVHATALLRRLAPMRNTPEEQAESWTLMAEAAADAGLARQFAAARTNTHRLLHALEPEQQADVLARLAVARERLRPAEERP